MIVLDATAAVALLLRTRAAADVDEALGNGPLHVPLHFDAEVYGGVRRELALGRTDAGTAMNALLELRRMRVERHAITPHLLEAFALRDRFGSHDVFYALLARRLNATLVTRDAHFSRAAEGFAKIRYVA